MRQIAPVGLVVSRAHGYRISHFSFSLESTCSQQIYIYICFTSTSDFSFHFIFFKITALFLKIYNIYFYFIINLLYCYGFLHLASTFGLVQPYRLGTHIDIRSAGR